jgi:hypothetical protein
MAATASNAEVIMSDCLEAIRRQLWADVYVWIIKEKDTREYAHAKWHSDEAVRNFDETFKPSATNGEED